MTREEARIIMLEDLLERSRNAIWFMHGCLTDDHFSYEYPNQTHDLLKSIGEYLPPREYCVHSYYDSECNSCVDRVSKWDKVTKAKKVLRKDS